MVKDTAIKIKLDTKKALEDWKFGEADTYDAAIKRLLLVADKKEMVRLVADEMERRFEKTGMTIKVFHPKKK